MNKDDWQSWVQSLYQVVQYTLVLQMKCTRDISSKKKKSTDTSNFLNVDNRMRTIYPHGLNKEPGLKFTKTYRLWQIPEEGQKV